MILYIARHGQTEWNATHRCQGHVDVALSETGRAQAAALSRRMSDAPLSAVFSSDLGRANETARIIAEPHALSVRTDPRLREINLGGWEGLTHTELAERYPEERALWASDPAACRPGGGETLVETQARFVAAIEAIRSASADDAQVLLVSHGYATLSYLCYVLELPLASFRRLWLDPTGLSEVRFSGDKATIRRINDTAHVAA